MKTRVLDMAYGALFCAAAFYLFWVSVMTGTDASRISSDPMWYPQVLLVLLAICSGYLVLRGAVSRDATRSKALAWRPTLIALTLAGLYLALFERVGLVPTSLVLIPVMSWLLGFRRPVLLAAIAIGFTGAVWYGFYYLINITPPGPGLPTLTG